MSSCFEEPGTEILFEGEFLEVEAGTTVTGDKTYAYDRQNDGVGVPSGFNVVLASAHKSTDVNFTFEVDTASTAIENIHYELNGNSGTIVSNSSSVELPITILDDNINPGEVWTIVVNLTSGDVEINPNYASGTHIIQVACAAPDDIATEYTFVHRNNFTGNEQTGTGSMTNFGSSMTEFVFTDFSFGSWTEAYGIDPPSGNIRFIENCGAVSIAGSDNYGDQWMLNEVLESGGPVFTFTWSNSSSYNEFGEVSLTRTDGSNWPAFIK